LGGGQINKFITRHQGVYQPGKVREFQRSGKNREKSGNFLIGEGIFIVNIILRKFAILALIFMFKKIFFARYARNTT
jgi:hypothetical protein